MTFSFDNLPAVSEFALLAEPAAYHPPPDDWWVLVTDVRGSTNAIEAGRYKEVNMLGAASIAAARNASGGANLAYVFGGDGATLVVPPEHKSAIAAGLLGLASHAEEVYGLGLRVGGLTVGEVRARGGEFSIARFALAPDVDLAMFWGDGCSIAEDLVKSGDAAFQFEEQPVEPDLTGLQCRWRPVPSRNGAILSILIKALGDSATVQQTYKELFERLDKLGLSAPEQRPIDRERLELNPTSEGLRAETQLVGEEPTKWRLKVGKVMMKRGWSFGGFDGKNYPDSLVSRTDFRKFDDALRMVVDVDDATRQALERDLQEFRDAGRIAYGTFASSEALITCIIQNFETRHVHFVDGGNGGYALAAKQLKAQLSENTE